MKNNKFNIINNKFNKLLVKPWVRGRVGLGVIF